jgi:hypothetical protein
LSIRSVNVFDQLSQFKTYYSWLLHLCIIIWKQNISCNLYPYVCFSLKIKQNCYIHKSQMVSKQSIISKVHCGVSILQKKSLESVYWFVNNKVSVFSLLQSGVLKHFTDINIRCVQYMFSTLWYLNICLKGPSKRVKTECNAIDS